MPLLGDPCIRKGNPAFNRNKAICLIESVSDVSMKNFENDSLTYKWEILYESTDLGVGGDYESKPASLTGLITNFNRSKIELKTPDEKGAFRLFVYITDNKNKVATANIPFFVK